MQILFEPILNNWWHKAATFWQTKHTVQWLLTLHLPGFGKQNTQSSGCWPFICQVLTNKTQSSGCWPFICQVLSNKRQSSGCCPFICRVLANKKQSWYWHIKHSVKWSLTFHQHTALIPFLHKSGTCCFSPPPLTTQLTLILLTWYTAPNYTAHTDSTHLIHCPKLHSSHWFYSPDTLPQTTQLTASLLSL